MTQAVAWLLLVALIGVVVAVFVRAQRRERSGAKQSFLPQSPLGQITAVVLGLGVVAMLVTAFG